MIFTLKQFDDFLARRKAAKGIIKDVLKNVKACALKGPIDEKRLPEVFGPFQGLADDFARNFDKPLETPWLDITYRIRPPTRTFLRAQKP